MSDIQLISNFHTHTKLCKHAAGMPEDYVKEAIKQGCSALGFSDHCPYQKSQGENWDNCKMSPSEILTYVTAVKEASKIANFPVYVGFECEYDKNFYSWYKDELKGHYGADYLVFGPHWLTLENSHPYILDINRDSKLLYKYTDQVIEGIQSGLFSFLAHPDLFMLLWKKWDDDAKSCLKAILDCAIQEDLPIEINGLGLKRYLIDQETGKEYGYPFPEFWQMVATTNAKVICNADAHEPVDVIKNARCSRAFAKEYGITPIESIF